MLTIPINLAQQYEKLLVQQDIRTDQELLGHSDLGNNDEIHPYRSERYDQATK